MTELIKPIPKTPSRMSAPQAKTARTNPLIIVGGLIGGAVVVLLMFLFTNSIELVVVLVLFIVLICLILFIRNSFKKKLPLQPKGPARNSPQSTNKSSTGNSINDPLLPFREEAKAEWVGLMKFLHIYDQEKEDRNLDTYRKLRGWK